MMDVNLIIVSLFGMMGLLAIAAWLFDQWRNKEEDDDWEPYG
jgi:hypothetical protein